MVLFVSSLVIAKKIERRLRIGCSKTPEGNKPPRIRHAIIQPSKTKNRRVIIVGDVHGCLDELQTLLSLCGYQHGMDLVIQVGDLVNKGPYSSNVLKVAQEQAFYAVRGNHDDAAVSAYRDWLVRKRDGRHILEAHKLGWVKGLTPELALFLETLPFTLRLPAYGILIVHAGLLPGRPLEKQEMFDMIKMRDVVPAAKFTSVGTDAPNNLAFSLWGKPNPSSQGSCSLEVPKSPLMKKKLTRGGGLAALSMSALRGGHGLAFGEGQITFFSGMMRKGVSLLKKLLLRAGSIFLTMIHMISMQPPIFLSF